MKCYENVTVHVQWSRINLAPKMCHEEEFKCECLLAELEQAVSVMCTFYTVVLKVVSKGPSYRVNLQLL